MVTKSWTGTIGNFSDTTWSDNAAPAAGDVAVISSGTVTADLLPSPITINVNASNTSSASLILASTTLAAGSVLALASNGSNASLRVNGTVANAGSIRATGFSPGSASLTLDNAPGGGATTLVNTGTILISDVNAQIVNAGNNSANQIQNDGILSVRSPSQTPHFALSTAAINGTGIIDIGCCVTFEEFGRIGAGQTIVFERGIASASTLRIDTSASFAATLSGFAAADTIQMIGGRWDAFAYAATSASSGTLNLTLNGVLVKSLGFQGNYTTDSFNLVQNTPTGSSQSTTVIKTTVAEVAPAIKDLNGDGTSDLLWQRNDGLIVDWSMKGGAISSGAIVSGLDGGWVFLAAADLDGDGKADMLWRQQSSGLIVDWTMNGPSIASGAIVAALGLDWDFLGASDLNGDGKADMLWRQQSSGLIVDWTMNGPAITSGAIVAALDSSWKFLGTADFNGDGKSDLLWQHAGDGLIVDWTMNGPTIAAGGIVAALPDNWKLLGTGDFDGNAKSDMLWQDSATGNIVEWSMNGSTIASSNIVGALDNSWSVIGTGDYNGDGKSDIMWRNTSGLIVDWTMNGATVQSGAIVSSLDSTWQPLV